jgi:hypothetical protein
MAIPTGARSQGAGAAARRTKDRDIGDAQANQELRSLAIMRNGATARAIYCCLLSVAKSWSEKLPLPFETGTIILT